MAWSVAPHSKDLAEVCAVDLAVEVDVCGSVVAGVGVRDDEPLSNTRRRRIGAKCTRGGLAVDSPHLYFPIRPRTHKHVHLVVLVGTP